MPVAFVAAFAAIGMLLSCEKAENLFCGYTAYFHYNPVSAKPNLYRACTSLGEFCTITYPLGVGQNYVVKSPSTPSYTDYIPRTALQGYREFILGIGGGLIVGKPMLPEMLEQECYVVCYDLCCSNCYHDYHFQKQLNVGVGGIASCQSCQRVYDLNNQGMISSGEVGRSLFRYYVNYHTSTQTLTVSNK